MKKHIAITAFLLVVGILNLSSCKESGVDERDAVSARLRSGKWKLDNVTVDGVNRNDLFVDFEITFSAGTYSSVNGDPVWPPSGTWAFTNDKGTAVTRNDDVVVTIESLTDSNLKLALYWTGTTLGSGKVKSVEGNHVFELSH